MAENFATPIHEWFELVWNQGREEAIDRLMDPKCLCHGLGEKPMQGPAEFKKFWKAYRGAFPDIRVKVLDTVVQDEKYAARCLVEGTHHGETLGMPATGRPIAVPLFGIACFHNGKMTEVWNHYPVLEMNQQLGIL